METPKQFIDRKQNEHYKKLGAYADTNSKIAEWIGEYKNITNEPQSSEMKKLYEILVPASNNKDLRFTYEHHKEWDDFVMGVAKGVTILKTGKGQWVSPNGELYKDRVIPCRIACTPEEIDKIINFTIEHYQQEAVMAYCISEEVIIKYKNNL